MIASGSPMPDRDHVAGVAAHIFAKFLRSNHQLTDLKQLGGELPQDATVLHYLQALCMSEMQVAMTRGRHTEVRRLSDLAQQLQEQAERADPNSYDRE